MEIVALVLAIAVIILTTYIFIKEYKDERNKDKKRYVVGGIKIFGIELTSNEYLSFINSCISYLFIYNELDLSNFINSDLLARADISDFHLIERTINMYPVLSCKYISSYKYILNRDVMIDKYDEYFNKTGEHEFIIPLFDFNLVAEHDDMFNIVTRHQQHAVAEEIVNRSSLKLNFKTTEKTLNNFNGLYSKLWYED